MVSGNTDLVTLVVSDSSGNPITGLPSGAFAFSLAGGSTGTFGPVVETATKGTYASRFTGTTAGTTSTLTATVSGVAIATRPSVAVVPGNVSTANSSAQFATSTVNVGSTDVVTLVVKDAAGNGIAGLPSRAFLLSLSGGASAGTFGTLTATATPGTYTALFTGTTAGTASTLTTTINGIVLNSAPAVTVNALPGTAPKITLNPTSHTAKVGTTVTFEAAASGKPTPTVQWQVSVAGGPFTNIAGATAASYRLIVTSNENSEQFRAVFTNSAGQATTSAATLTTTGHNAAASLRQLHVRSRPVRHPHHRVPRR